MDIKDNVIIKYWPKHKNFEGQKAEVTDKATYNLPGVAPFTLYRITLQGKEYKTWFRESDLIIQQP